MNEELKPKEAANMVKKDHVNWIDVESTNEAMVQEVTELFTIHHLVAEDILNLDQLPKFELFDQHLFFNTKMLNFDDNETLILKEHLSIVMSKNLLITFQEGIPGDAFSELRLRIQLAKGIIRKYEVDYLFYHILDAVVIHYLQIMETLRERIESLESRALADPRYDAAGIRN
ncbi:MAG: magnesium transporter [Cyclobacteriaceae bacterium]|jgi:magnesium transporter